MSLLIKALASAEKDKQLEKSKPQTGTYVADDALSLEPPLTVSQIDELAKFAAETSAPEYEKDFDFVLSANDFTDDDISLETEAGLSLPTLSASHYVSPPKLDIDKPVAKGATNQGEGQAVDVKQKAAAKVFVANQSAKAPTSKSALILLGVVGALMIWLGLQGYAYIQAPIVPQVVVAKAAPQAPAQVATQPESLVTAAVQPPVLPVPASDEPVSDHHEKSIQLESDQASNSHELGSSSAAFKNAGVKNDDSHERVATHHEGLVRGSVVKYEKPEATHTRKQFNNSDASMSIKDASQQHEQIRLVSKLSSVGVDPTLLSAYQAFTRGEDASAQQQYRQVLQHDVRNVDALLGMAAIAQRQGRDADATGWYQKVLEIEPRNMIAQSAVVSSHAGGDTIGAESRIKSMLAQQPDAANLHEALGNMYAEQNQWASAQEAYFNATRYAPNNADYVFNLAISLDQLGKFSLALNQYQRALALLNKSGATSPDRASLEARIHALQK
ncbi:cellulose synthase subunit BcsC [mine drainage metagenome]|uniref:Cellulose synthase subunit BcsC n=1 Tax=mine drainage metagenome TaxID=410659 RepID=A0A1J5RSE5_9ZZZZ